MEKHEQLEKEQQSQVSLLFLFSHVKTQGFFLFFMFFLFSPLPLCCEEGPWAAQRLQGAQGREEENRKNRKNKKNHVFSQGKTGKT